MPALASAGRAVALVGQREGRGSGGFLVGDKAIQFSEARIADL